jgi:beta-galactosidase
MKALPSLLILLAFCFFSCNEQESAERERISLNSGWKFFKYNSLEEADNLIYDVRPETDENLDQREADAKPEEAETLTATQQILKPWILPTGNRFLKDTANGMFALRETRAMISLCTT